MQKRKKQRELANRKYLTKLPQTNEKKSNKLLDIAKYIQQDKDDKKIPIMHEPVLK